MKEVNISKAKISQFGYIVLYVFCFFGNNVKFELSNDTYPMFFESVVDHMIYTNGRPIIGLVYLFLERVGCPIELAYSLSFFSALIFLSLAIWEYSIVISNYIKGKELFACILASITISNLFIIEYFLFIEKGMFMFALFLVTLSVRLTNKYLTEMNMKDCICAWGLLIIAAFTYQVIVSMYVILLLPFILLHSPNLWSFVRNNIIVACGYGIALLFPFAFLGIFAKSERISATGNSIIESAEQWNNNENMTAFRFIISRITMEMWIYASITVVLVIVLSIIVWSLDRHMEIIKGLYLAAGTLVVGFLPIILKLSSGIKPRLVYPAFSLVGILLVYGAIKRYFFYNSSKAIDALLVLAVAILFVSNHYAFQRNFMTRYITNNEDRNMCEEIGTKIDIYEKQYGEKVEKVVFYEDCRKTKYLDDWCLTYKAFSSEYSRIPALNYYLGSSYTEGIRSEELTSFYGANNWDKFNDELVRFEGNTIHLCVY